MENLQAVVEAGARTTVAQNRIATIQYKGVEVPIVIGPSGGVGVLEDAARFVESRAAAPLARVVKAEVDDLDSLIGYVNRQKLSGQTVAFARKAAPPASPTMLVVFDWHRENAGEPGWSRDSVRYAPKLSRQYLAWTQFVAEPKSQDAFADFLEDNVDDIAERDGFPLKLDLIKMARDLHVSVGQKLSRTVDPASGDVTFSFQAETGGQGKTKIPREFLLGIPVFDGSDVIYAIRVSTKLQLAGERAFFAMKLRNADVALEDAFADVKKAVAEKCSIPVFAGVP